MSETPRTTYSTDGPTCPGCGSEYTPDETWYYEQGGYKITCDECACEFMVMAEALWSWESTELIREAEPIVFELPVDTVIERLDSSAQHTEIVPDPFDE